MTSILRHTVYLKYILIKLKLKITLSFYLIFVDWVVIICPLLKLTVLYGSLQNLVAPACSYKAKDDISILTSYYCSLNVNFM